MIKKLIITLIILSPVFLLGQDNIWHELPVYGGAIHKGVLSPSHPDSIMIFTSYNCYTTHDAGGNWDQFMGISCSPNVRGIYIHPNYPDSVFLSFHPRLSVSGDFGQSWSHYSLPDTFKTIGRLALSYKNTKVVYIPDVYMPAEGKLYKTTNGGQDWSIVFDRPEERMWGVSISQEHPDTLFTAVGDSIFRSNNGGGSWINITNDYYTNGGATPNDIFVSPYDDELIIVTTAGDIISISYNGGNTWSTTSLTDFPYSLYVTFSVDNNTIYLASTNKGIYSSTDRGVSFSKMSTPGLLNLDIRRVLENPQSTNVLYALTDGSGVYKTVDSGLNWNPANTNIDEVFVRDVVEKPGDPNRIIAASEEGGIFRSVNGGGIWSTANYGLDYIDVHKLIWPGSQPNDPKKVVALSKSKGVYISDNDGAEWILKNSGSLSSYYDMAYDSVDNKIYVVGAGGMIETDDWGDLWNSFSTPPTMASPTKVVYHPFNVAIYIGSIYSTGIHKYQSGGWSNISGLTLADKEIWEIAVHPSNPDTIYVRADDRYIYATANGGTSWEQIYYISDGSIYVELYFDPVQPSIRYIFHGEGIKSFDSGQTWYTLPPGGGFTGDISCNDRQTLYTKSRDGLYRLHQAPELSAPTQVDAGQVSIGGNNTIEIIFENTGYAIMDISNLALAGSHTSHWQIINNHSMNLSYQDKDTLFVSFDPDSVGDLPIQLTGESTDPQQPDFSVTLNGAGGGGLLSPNPSALNFGDVYYQTSKDTILTITNTGNDSLNITSTNISGSHASMFSIITGGGSRIIEPAASHQITMRFIPSNTGSFSASLAIVSNDPYHPTTNVSLSGVGVVADIDLGGVNSVNFGTVYIGNFNDQIVQINNLGAAGLVVDSIAILDTTFKALSPATPFTVDAAENRQVSVRFYPDAAGSYNTTMKIYSNDPDESPASVTLLGNCSNVPTGVIDLSHIAHNFGSVLVGETSAVWELTITNNSESYDFQIDSITINKDVFFMQEQLTFPYQMNPSFSIPLHFYFTPDSVRIYNDGLVTIYSTASNGTQQVNLQGIGYTNPTGTIEISTNEIVFGEVLVDSTSEATILTINNTSSDYSFSIDSLVISPQAFQYDFEQNLPYVLMPQQHVDVEFTFTPADSDSCSGEFYIYSDAINNSTLRVDLSGKGKYPEEPTVTFNPGTITAFSGSDAAISISVDSDLPLEYVRIFYAKGGIAQFDSTNMTNSSGIEYSGTIGSGFITESGLKYYFKISDGQHFVRYPAAGGINLPVTITNLDRSIEAGGVYQMISIPMSPDDGSPLSVLGDNLGEYDIYKWRMFRWIDGEYVELNDQDKDMGSFSPGAAFWLAAKSATSFNTGSGVSTPVADTVTVNLQEGWNQISDPFSFAVAWSSVVKSGQVGAELWGYNTTDKGFEQINTLLPWEGYFVRALDASSSLAFPPHETTIPKQVVYNTGKDGWLLQIKADAGKAKDKYNFIGMQQYASDEYDWYDCGEPPVIGDYISVYFPHLDWEFSGGYSADIRSSENDGAVWDMIVKSNIESAGADLTFHKTGQIPPDYEMWLWDKKLNVPVNLIEAQHYNFRFKQNESERRFQLIIGNTFFVSDQFEDLNILPDNVTLYPNFPNPFNPETAIKFALPKDANTQMIVCNILGQKVKTLISAQMMSKGYHSVLWDSKNDSGMNQASGIYFIILRVDHEVKTLKTVLLR